MESADQGRNELSVCNVDSNKSESAHLLEFNTDSSAASRLLIILIKLIFTVSAAFYSLKLFLFLF